MKKLFAYLAIFGMLSFGTTAVMAQEEAAAAAQTEQTTETVASQEAPAAQAEQGGIHKQIKIKFVEGGVAWMLPILLCLIIGLAIVIERIIYLNLSTTNTKKLLQNIENALNDGGVEAAKEVCRNTRGPVASIFYQGLDRYEEGVDVIEKSVVSYGSVQMGQMEKGLTWISLFIALSPMLGFMGTVVGMIQAFDQIQAMGDISPTAVAGGIKVALLTTVFGLIAAMILQIFYNYLVSKIDGIVNNMEDSSISLLDIVVKYKLKH
ncbi:MAG: MotA/TolQ/ExbB proton channel family protein [Breznakibacter sp.]